MIFPTAEESWMLTADVTLESNALQAAIMEQLGDAYVTGAKSTTQSLSGYETEEIAPVLADLRQKGYQATVSGSTLTIAWGPYSPG